MENISENVIIDDATMAAIQAQDQVVDNNVDNIVNNDVQNVMVVNTDGMDDVNRAISADLRRKYTARRD